MRVAGLQACSESDRSNASGKFVGGGEYLERNLGLSVIRSLEMGFGVRLRLTSALSDGIPID